VSGPLAPLSNRIVPILNRPLARTGAWLRRSLFAQECVLCAAPGGAGFFCPGCDREMPRPAEACPQCAGPSPGGAVCGACLRAPPSFDTTIAAWRYEFPVDRLVQTLKYGGRLALADAFAAALACALGARRVELLVPMPLSAARLRERGFNQAMEIARHLARRSGTRIDAHAVARIRDTPPQTDLPHDARAANVRGAFACTGLVAGLNVALVDDVMTTGASLEELARTLKAAGAAGVENWVVARTWPRSAGEP
jgi:ComF family protein